MLGVVQVSIRFRARAASSLYNGPPSFGIGFGGILCYSCNEEVKGIALLMI